MVINFLEAYAIYVIGTVSVAMCYMYKCRAIATFSFLFFVYLISLINEFHCDIREPVPRIQTLLRRSSSVVRTSLISLTLHSHSCIKYLALDNGRYT